MKQFDYQKVLRAVLVFIARRRRFFLCYWVALLCDSLVRGPGSPNQGVLFWSMIAWYASGLWDEAEGAYTAAGEVSLPKEYPLPAIALMALVLTLSVLTWPWSATRRLFAVDRTDR